jgi:hypothetical protein
VRVKGEDANTLYFANLPVFAAAREIAETYRLPIHADRAEQDSARAVVIADVVDFEAAGVDVAQ